MIEYVDGDQVECRIVVWWQPGEHLVKARTLATVFRGDTALDQQVGERTTLRSKSEAIAFALAFVDAVWWRMIRECATTEEPSSDLGDAHTALDC